MSGSGNSVTVTIGEGETAVGKKTTGGGSGGTIMLVVVAIGDGLPSSYTVGGTVVIRTVSIILFAIFVDTIMVYEGKDVLAMVVAVDANSGLSHSSYI